MSENMPKTNIKNFEFRAKIPQIVRFVSIAALGVLLIVIGIGFWLNFGKEDFRMKGIKELSLSKDVIAEFSNYERRENDGDKLNYLVKADRVRTFSDNHQELDNIFLQVFDDSGEHSDKIMATKAIYVPDKDNSKSFTAFFSGEVRIESRDKLVVKTDQLMYKKASEIAEAEEFIEFSRENVKGSAVGALVNTREKTIELLKDVDITVVGNEVGESEKLEHARLLAGRAFFDQTAEKIEFSENVDIKIVPKNDSEGNLQPTDVLANQATAIFVDKELDQIDLKGNVFVHQKATAKNPKWSKTKANRASAKIKKELKRLELFENVDIQTTTNNAKPTKVTSNYAVYEKDLDRFELKENVEILTIEDSQSTIIRSQYAVYEQSNGKIFLNGDAKIIQPNDYIKGDSLTAYLLSNKKIKSANVKGNAFLKQTGDDRTTEVSAGELNAIFDDKQLLQTATTLGQSSAVLIPSTVESYTKVTLTAPRAINLRFKTGLISNMETEGRTTISLESPNNDPESSNKKITADSVKTLWNDGGKDIKRAEAVGNAVLLIQPLRNSVENYKTTINAPRFDCDFFEGNNAKSCSGGTNVKTVRVPTVAKENRGTQTLTSNQLNAYFNAKTKDLDKLEAVGNAKFSELDKNGIAETIAYTQADAIVRLRGGEPTFWDSQARLRGGEVDWDTKNQKSYYRNGVATTYYSQKKTGGATPFGDVNSPVFLTAKQAEIDHQREIAVYTGDARAWQDNNYVRADRLILDQKESKLDGEGSVQSLLYDAKRKDKGKETTVPVYASADKIHYLKINNYLRYEGNVDIRQQTDRITGGIANVYLNSANQVSETIVEQNVVITQPGKRATADYARYDLSDESIVLKGNPATVDDRENGATQAAQLTVYMRDNRVIAESKTPVNNSGRIRSVYNVKNQD